MTHNSSDGGQTFFQKKFPWTGHFDTALFTAVVESRFRSSTGHYDWEFGKLIIYLWESHLRGSDGAPEKKPWEKFAWDESVEHIYPQKPHPAWSSDIVVDGRAHRAKNAITHSLGNLLLLSRSVNSTNSNHPFVSDDPALSKRRRFRSGSYSEVQVAFECESWAVVQIAARGIAMMRLAQKTWGFELVADDALLTEWLPFLFGEVAPNVQQGDFSHGTRIDGRALNVWVRRFEESRSNP